MIAAGTGEKKLQLSESTTTLQQFRQLINDHTFQVNTSSTTSHFDQVLDLARFLDKYDCEYVLAISSRPCERAPIAHGPRCCSS